MIYFLKHPDTLPNFNGKRGPLEFVNGVATTSNLQDRDFGIRVLGCVDVTDDHAKAVSHDHGTR